jgi:hypothetical protein
MIKHGIVAPKMSFLRSCFNILPYAIANFSEQDQPDIGNCELRRTIKMLRCSALAAQ